MRVLGVDPGSRITGWGWIEGPAARPRVGGCGRIRLSAADSLGTRLARLRGEFDVVVRTARPTVAAVEAPFHGKSSRAALQLAHARGVLLGLLAEARIEVAEYAPATVKQSIAGSGRADKLQVRRMVERLLQAAPLPVGHDVSDALAVAWCHWSRASFARRVAGAGGPASDGRRAT